MGGWGVERGREDDDDDDIDNDDDDDIDDDVDIERQSQSDIECEVEDQSQRSASPSFSLHPRALKQRKEGLHITHPSRSPTARLLVSKFARLLIKRRGTA